MLSFVLLERKRETTSEDLCKNYPHEFFEYVDYTRKLEYEENPNYDLLKQKFKDVLKEINEEMAEKRRLAFLQ